MGVHDLWSIVEPVRESVPLYSLSGKTLAVDLSLWVCEAQHVQAMMGRVTRPHLRNLFFRVSSLTLMGVKLVFVMEGEAPQLKADTMSKRTEKRFGGFKKAAAPKRPANPSRGRFRAVLRECSEMLDYLGLPWVTAAGEAEAMCAYLDSQGLVDGCITNDGDAFLYGARTVYRNFNMNTKDPQVDCYKTSRVQTELHLSRENLVGLAILLGCDYIPKGIPGVGREQALKLIHTLKGQTLLQKFTQWKEENTGVSEGVVKKVPHCHICRHPGSVKAHERGGCVLCDSQRFCQPQDFDYQCPCEWHRHEQSRQALAVEANVRKKTLANQQFPFTEIICEFLISKDKPVSNFKRRQPNMLSMQKLALDKMEWPKHYTSEKVLVLMTYSELMTRKYGRKMTSQIKPLRIWKPRVRNGVACYEVIWSTPDHYVFPEDQPAEDQHEVRSVEEESLFRVAFPEVVERYLTDKALAEENKTKKKKPKTKKEKTSDGQNDISDLMAQMSLQSAPSEDAASRSQTLPPPISNVKIPEVIIVDTPVSHKHQHRTRQEEPDSRADEPETAASPSVSAVIEALHLSDIDWDATSFSASPPPQAAAVHLTESTRSTHTLDEQKAPKDVRQAEVSSDIECPLRERVLMRNTARAQSQLGAHSDEVSIQLNYELTTSECSSSHNFKPSAQKSSKENNATEGSAVNTKEPLIEKVQHVTNTVEAQTRTSKSHFKPMAQDKSKKVDVCKDSQKPQKYKFVKTAVVASAKCHSDSAQSDKDRSVPQTTKKSVCWSTRSSSEDSDTENQQHGPQRRNKAKIKGSLLQGIPLKPLFAPKPAKPEAPLLGPKYLQQNQDVTENKSQEVLLPFVRADVAAWTPASPVIVSDSDDSVICGDSPLPLAERLRLKFLN